MSEQEVVITAYEDGPYVVNGPACLKDSDGNAWSTEGRRSFALCRCGASTNKPFCDGTHSKIGFKAAGRAAGEG
jgi:CDGSH-type Zn-finger protein